MTHRDYHLGGELIRVRFASESLEACIHPALAHREETNSANSTPELTVDVVESRESPLRLSKQEWSQVPLKWQQGESIKQGLFVDYSVDSQYLTVFAPAENRAVVCLRSVDAVTNALRAKPLCGILNAAFQRRASQVVHAACISRDNACVLIVGAGGSGKSNTALSCLSHPKLCYLGDDLCLVRLTEKEAPTAYSLYNSAILWPHDLDRYSHLPVDRAYTGGNNGRDKPAFPLFPAMAEKLADAKPVVAIMISRVTGRRDTKLEPATTADAWRAIVPSTFKVVMGNRPAAMQTITELIQSVPCYWLKVGTDRQQIPDTVNRYLVRKHITASEKVAA